MIQVQELFDNHILLFVMAALCGLGILVKFLIYGIYKNLIMASDNMPNTNNKLMKLVKMKFEACYKLKIGVSNVDIFVDKYMYKYKYCGVLLYTWENISGQLLILCLLTGAVGAGLAVYYECGKTAILSTFFIGLLTSALLIIFESFLNLTAKRNVIRVNMKDYLENMLKVRLEKEHFHPEKLEAYRKEYFETNNKETNTMVDIKNNIIPEEKEERIDLKKPREKDLLHIEDTAASIEKDHIRSKLANQQNSNTRKQVRSIDKGNQRTSKEMMINVDKASNAITKDYKINKNEEEIIEDILKEFMA